MQVTPANEGLNFVADSRFFCCLCCDLSHFSLPLHCLMSLGHFSLMSDHAVISAGSSLTPGSLTSKLQTSVAYSVEPVLCALGVLLSVLCQQSKDSFRVSYSNKELDPSRAGVLKR